MKRKIMIGTILLTMIVASVLLIKNYFDHPKNDWEEIIKNYEEEEKITYAQFLQLLLSANMPEFDFEYVNTDYNHWAGSYITLAEEYGLFPEDDIMEKIEEPITRKDAMIMMGLSDLNLRKCTQLYGENLSFSDVEELNEVEKMLLRHVVASGFLGKEKKEKFRPDDFLTCEEVTEWLSAYQEIS